MATPTWQEKFNLTIGQLDRTLSEMMVYAKVAAGEATPVVHACMDEENRQTLKHHAEDMILCGNAILKKLGKGQPPVPEGYVEVKEGSVRIGDLCLNRDGTKWIEVDEAGMQHLHFLDAVSVGECVRVVRRK